MNLNPLVITTCNMPIKGLGWALALAFSIAGVCIAQTTPPVSTSYETWTHSGSLFILTTPDGTNITSGPAETNFPLLLRFNSGNFPFAQAASDGRDIRFATAAGLPLSYQIEQWDSANGKAAVWVKIPSIAANATQQIKMHWGQAGVVSESDGTAVFNAANGFATVMHLNETLADTVGTITPANNGTTVADGIIGKGRSFTPGRGVNGGENITTYPSSGAAHSTSGWFKSDSSNSASLVRWGQVEDNSQMEIELSPAPTTTAIMNGFWSPATIRGTQIITRGEWTHIAYTYASGAGKLFVNCILDSTASGNLSIPSPAVMYLGRGWQGDYSYSGVMDEVRISRTARSANWVKLEYENQKPLQTLVGHLVQSGTTFSASPASATFPEGGSTTLTGQAGGAQKVYWIEKRNGVDTVLATDTFSLPLTAGRVNGDQSHVIQFKAVYPSPALNQTVDIPVTITEDLPDPVFTLSGPSTWEGRQTITVSADISNLATLQVKNVANMTYQWSVNGVAATKTTNAGTTTVPGSLTFTRAHGDGPMTVTLVLGNGGSPVTASKTLTVQQPTSPEPWVERTPIANEKPVNGQFFARNPSTGMGTIFYRGTQTGSPSGVYLKVYKTPSGGAETLDATHRQALAAGAYSFTAPIAAGLFTYRVVYGTTTGGTDTDLATATDLVCGDAYIVNGQSNAESVAADGGVSTDATNPWIRTYRRGGGTWSRARSRAASDSFSGSNIGYWPMDLAQAIVTNHQMPVCIINGAVGGTRIDQHQANPANPTVGAGIYDIYANLLKRVIAARLTHGIRGIFWHQGENNSGSAGPDGDYDYKFYQPYFVDMSGAWKRDYPNYQRSIIFQVMPKPCGMGPTGDQLREVQRTLPFMYSNMSILNTLGFGNDGGCHFTMAGYTSIANRVLPVASRDFYGTVTGGAVTAPNLKRATFTSAARTAIALEFDQPMSWSNFSRRNYYVDDVGGKVTSGSSSGNIVTLQLNSAAAANATLDYLKDDHWNLGEGASTLLHGANGIPALTFADVPVQPAAATDTTPPTTSRLTPPDNATGVALGANLVATFSENIAAGAGNITIKNLTDATQTTIAVTNTTQISIFGTVLMVNPTSDLLADKNYAIQIAATAIGDLAGNAFGGITNDTTWNFTTVTDHSLWAALWPDADLHDPNADFDEDGVTNEYERIWGLDPTKAASRNPFKSLSGLTNGTFSYTRRATSLTGLRYTVWTSTNLTTWTKDNGAIQTPGVAVDEIEAVSVTLSSALITGAQLFIQIRASQP